MRQSRNVVLKSFVFKAVQLWFLPWLMEILWFYFIILLGATSVRNAERKQGRRGWSHEGQREGQEFDNRMCCHHIKSEPRTQICMLHARPSTVCVVEWVKLPPHWWCDDATKSDFVGLIGWLSCVSTQVHISSCDMKTSPGSFETPSWFRDVHTLHQVAS